MDLRQIFSVSLILFSVIDILGALPIILKLKNEGKKIEPLKVTIVSGLIMVGFLFTGEGILKLLNLDVESFALAGAFVLFLIGIEMILGIVLFKDTGMNDKPSVVPLAFPLIAGAGTMTTLISIKTTYELGNIIVGIILNLIFIYFTLKISGWLQRQLGEGGTSIIRKVFGVILLAIAIKLFKTNFPA